MPGLLDALNSPMARLGIGLMANSQNQKFGPALANTLGQMQAYDYARQQQQMMALRQQALMAKLEEQKRQREQQERIREGMGQIVGMPAQAMPHEADMFPGEAPIPGLLDVQQGSGLLGGDFGPQEAQVRMATMMAREGDPSALFSLMNQKPTSEKLVQAMVNGRPQWVPQSQAAGLPPVPREPLIDMREQMLPTREHVLREDMLSNAENARKRIEGYMKASNSAIRETAGIDRALSLLDTTPTGWGEKQKIDAKRMLAALGVGIDENSLASADELQKYLGDQLMARVAQTKGSVSDREMRLFEQFSASFGKTTEGNKRILQFQKALLDRDVEIGKLVRKLRKAGKTSLEIQDAVDQFVSENYVGDILENAASNGDVLKRADAILGL